MAFPGHGYPQACRTKPCAGAPRRLRPPPRPCWHLLPAPRAHAVRGRPRGVKMTVLRMMHDGLPHHARHRLSMVRGGACWPPGRADPRQSGHRPLARPLARLATIAAATSIPDLTNPPASAYPTRSAQPCPLRRRARPRPSPSSRLSLLRRWSSPSLATPQLPPRLSPLPFRPFCSHLRQW